jgi:hypothetical protein
MGYLIIEWTFALRRLKSPTLLAPLAVIINLPARHSSTDF